MQDLKFIKHFPTSERLGVKCLHTQQSIQQENFKVKKRDILMVEMTILGRKGLGRRDETTSSLRMFEKRQMVERYRGLSSFGFLVEGSWFDSSGCHG
jgi:hypothetical protein